MSELEDQTSNMLCSSSLYDPYVLEWVTEATRRIEELSAQVERLKLVKSDRTEGFA